MKKRMLCIVMVFVLIGLSVMIWPVSAEPMDTGTMDVVEETVTASTNLFTLSQTKKIMGVGTTATLSTVPATTAIWSSSNPSVVSVNGITGEVQALKRGTATITASYTFPSGETFSQSCQIRVCRSADIPSGDYYIQYKNADRYLIPVVNDPSMGSCLRVASKINSITYRWSVIKDGDSYLIKSVRHNMYLGISVNSISFPTLHSGVSDLTRWKIYENAFGYNIVPYLDQYTNGLVLSPSSNSPSNQDTIGLHDFFDSSVAKNWNLTGVSTHILNYYEYSINNNPTLINSILIANQFVQSYFDKVLGHDIYMLGSPSYYADLWINQCTCGDDEECTNSVDCYSHHKNYDRFTDEISQIPKNREQLLVMWSNHPSSNFYCAQDAEGNHAPKQIRALGDFPGGKRIRIFNYAIDPDWNPDVSATCILTHEIGHFFGIPEMYEEDPTGHSDTGPMVCMMQAYGYKRAEVFYDLLRRDNNGNITDGNIVDAFCDACWEMLCDNVEVS